MVNGTEPAVSLYSSGEPIYRQGDPPDALYLVKLGCVVLSRVSRSGTRQVGGFFLPGEVFGWETDAEHRFSAEAAGSTGLQKFAPKRTPSVAAWRDTQVIPSLTLLREQIAVLSSPSAASRVAAFLCDLMERQGSASRIDLLMNRHDIANYLGLSPETVSREFGRFQKLELISSRHVHLVDVLSSDRLRAMLRQ